MPSFLLSKIETEASVTGIPASFATDPLIYILAQTRFELQK
ncbi:hypothetical protein [Empedobacter sp.]|nr:hypothetical protein [Empedobacter sp.]